MPKWATFLFGVALLPFCVGAVHALSRVLSQSGRAEEFWIASAGGAMCWMVVYLLLPQPMWLYVLGHEFTHALWIWLFGGRVKRIKVASKGGHVISNKTNFLIALAPYFFPFYAVVVVLVYALGRWIFGWSGHAVWFHFILGIAYAFHLTLTCAILRTRQSDITSQGHLFSATIIFLGNVGVLLLGIPLVTAQVRLLDSLGWWLRETGDLLRRLGH